MKKIILDASWDLLEVVSNGVVLFLTVSVLLPKMIQKSTPKLPKSSPKSSPKPSRIHPKTFQNPPKNAPKTRSGGDCASDRFWAFFSLGSVGVLGRLGRLLGPSWSRLGVSGGVLEPSWHDLGAVLGRPWGVLGRLGASWGRLGSVFWDILEAFRAKLHEQLRFLIDFCSQLRIPKLQKSYR